MVVSRTHLIRISMRKLSIYPHLRVSDLVQRRRDRRPHPMAGELIRVPHTTQRAIQRVLTDTLAQVASMRK